MEAKITSNLNTGVKKVGYKSLRGFVQMLKRQNRRCEQLGVKCKFDITLPIKE